VHNVEAGCFCISSLLCIGEPGMLMHRSDLQQQQSGQVTMHPAFVKNSKLIQLV
jgi:hypothetical protein